jgi:hypothetical protein
MSDLALHLAPNAPWVWLLLFSFALLALAIWAYRIAIPPLPALAKRLLPALRAFALLALVWLLAQPVLERLGGDAAQVVVLRDRSSSMKLPASPDLASSRPTRAAEADRAVDELKRAWRGRARVQVLDFASRLGLDSTSIGSADGTALGSALASLGRSPAGERASAVVVVSDGVTNRGEDPLSAARELGVPVHAVIVGAGGPDRVVTEVEASAFARVGEPTPIRVRVTSGEPRGIPIPVTLADRGRVLARAVVAAPGPGAEATAELRVTPPSAGLAVWTARVDSIPGEMDFANNAREVALEVAPGKLGVLVLSGGLNWDLAFLRRSLAGDSSLSITTLARERDGWRQLETLRRRGAPAAADLRGASVVVLDALAGSELGDAMDRALLEFASAGGGLLVLSGAPPGLTRHKAGALGSQLRVDLDGALAGRPGTPIPTPEGRELLAWDEDPARGDAAWRAAAPLADVAPIAAGAGDRVLLATPNSGPPLLFSRRIGRGPVLMVNGDGLWRWSLSSQDELGADRGRVLWRRLVRWLAEPVQGDPVRVRPDRWLASGGDPVRLLATVQDASLRPVGGAQVTGELKSESGATRALAFSARDPGSYEAVLEDLPPGRYRVSVRAELRGKELGRSTSEVAVDRWSLEEARSSADSTALAQLAAASGGRSIEAGHIERWARDMPTRELARGRSESRRLWESPWTFAAIVGALGIEWGWRRRRGLP